ncbi:glycosyltransferase [Planctomycetota bacterium]
MGRPVRVLHVVGGLGVGGIETWLMEVLRCLNRERFRFDFLVNTDQSGQYDDVARAHGARVIPCLHPRRLWSYPRRFRRTLVEFGPFEIVHSHFDPCGLPLLLAHRVGVAIRVAHAHSNRRELSAYPTVIRTLFGGVVRSWLRRHATAGLATSRASATALFGSRWREDSRWHVLSCGVALDGFYESIVPERVRESIGIPTSAYIVCHVGRFEPVKNHGFILDVFSEVARQLPVAHLLLVGDGSERPAIESACHERGLRSRVTFAGERSDVPRLLKGAADVFLLPSLNEGLPLAAVEAQAAGLPCLCSDAVPHEAVVVPELVERLRIAAGSRAWAKRVLASHATGSPIGPDSALAAVRRSNANVTRSAERLQRFYLEQLSRQSAAR